MFTKFSRNKKFIIIGVLFLIIDIFFSVWFIWGWRQAFFVQKSFSQFRDESLNERQYKNMKDEVFLNGIVLSTTSDSLMIKILNDREIIYKVLPKTRFGLVQNTGNEILELPGYQLGIVEKGNTVWVRLDQYEQIDQILIFKL
jgi:hypothetical protein